MILRIETPPQAVSLTILRMNIRKPPSHMTQSWVRMTKSATALPTPRKKSETMVEDMDLSSIN